MLICYILKGLAGDDVLHFTFGHYHSTPQDRGGSHFEGTTQRKAAYSSPDWILAIFGQREGCVCWMGEGLEVWTPALGQGLEQGRVGLTIHHLQGPQWQLHDWQGAGGWGIGWARWVEGPPAVLSRYRPLTGGEPAEGWPPF